MVLVAVPGWANVVLLAVLATQTTEAGLTAAPTAAWPTQSPTVDTNIYDDRCMRQPQKSYLENGCSCQTSGSDTKELCVSGCCSSGVCKDDSECMVDWIIVGWIIALIIFSLCICCACCLGAFFLLHTDGNYGRADRVVHILDAGPDANFGPAPPPYDPEMAPGPPCPGLASEPSVQQAPLLEPATVVTTITVTSPA